MKIYYFLLLLFVSANLFSQKKFIQGYFIDNSGKRTECLINETAWESSKEAIEYKLADTLDIQRASVSEVKEYGSSNEFKVKRFNVDIDISTNGLKNISTYKTMTYENKKVFLMELVDGKAKLYVYQNDNQLKFFYTYKTDSPIQLEYKKYQYENEILSNQNYKQQLLNALKEEDVTLDQVSGIEYKKNALIDFFLKINGLTKEAVSKKEHKNKVDFNFYLKAGVQSLSFNADSGNDFIGSFEFKNKTDVKYGFELEFVFPFGSNKWALFIEAYHIKYKDEMTKSYGRVVFEYETFEVPVGTRFYFFLNDKSRIFLEGALQLSFMTKNKFKLANFQDVYSDFRNDPNFHFGLGYNFNNKFNITLGTMTNRSLISSNGWDSNFKNYSLTLGYNLWNG